MNKRDRQDFLPRLKELQEDRLSLAQVIGGSVMVVVGMYAVMVLMALLK